MLCLDPSEHLEVDLSAALGESTAVDVHLAVPHLKPGGENVSRDGKNAAARYRLYQTTWKDETGWSSDQDIECRKLGVELLATPAGENKPSGYETLKIARIMRVGWSPAWTHHPPMRPVFSTAKASAASTRFASGPASAITAARRGWRSSQ